MSTSSTRSSTGLDTNLAGALCYLLGVLSGIVFLIVEKEDQTVRFHAYQSTAAFGLLLVLSAASGFVPFVGWIVGVIAAPLTLVLWLFLMVKAFQGERYELPVVGEWASQQVR